MITWVSSTAPSAGWVILSTQQRARSRHRASVTCSAPATNSTTAELAAICRCTCSTVRWLRPGPKCLQVKLLHVQQTITKPGQPQLELGSGSSAGGIVTVERQVESQYLRTKPVLRLVRRQPAAVVSHFPALTATSRPEPSARASRRTAFEELP